MSEETYSLEPTDDPPRPVHPVAPRPAGNPLAQIVGDRACKSCGYNLRGLNPDGKCPECGQPIEGQPDDLAGEGASSTPASPVMAVIDRAWAEVAGVPQSTPRRAVCPRCGESLEGRPRRGMCPKCGVHYEGGRFADVSMQDMPMALIGRCRIGAWLAAVAVTAALGVRYLGGTALDSDEARFLVAVAAAGAWIAACWLLTPALEAPAAVKRGFGRSSRLRRAARWLAWAWIGRIVAIQIQSAVAISGALPAWVLTFVIIFASLAGLIGVGAMTLLLIRLADWVRDDFAERTFNFVLWGTTVGLALTTALALMMELIGGAMMIFILVLWVLQLACVAAVVAMPVGLFALARSLDWSIRHVHDKEARDEAHRERLVTRGAKSATPQWTENRPIGLAPTSGRQLEIQDPSPILRRRAGEHPAQEVRPPSGDAF